MREQIYARLTRKFEAIRRELTQEGQAELDGLLWELAGEIAEANKVNFGVCME